MKCEDFLPSWQTGGWWRRLAARRHAARCPRCAAVRQRFAAALQGFAEPAAVSAELRARWCDAAESTPVVAADRSASHGTYGRRNLALACAASLAAVVAVGLWLWPEGAREGDRQVATVVEVDAAPEFVRLESSLALLDQELQLVEQEIERMQARQLAADLLRRHGRP